MRILIDLESSAAPASIALAQELARSAGEHQLWIVLSAAAGASIEQVRQAFRTLLPRERVAVYELPAATTAWRTKALNPVHEHFLAALRPDVVFAPRAEEPAFSRSFATLARLDHGRDVWEQLAEAKQAHVAQAAPARPRLAYISPLPPQHSGIADYSAELAPELARYYDVELIVDQPAVGSARLTSSFPVRQLAWFDKHAHEFDRVLYHFGNSGVHRHMFEMIRRHPGIVVLHDFFLSGVLDNLETEGYLPHAFLRALYESHGYSGLLEHRKCGRNASIWKYPLNKGVLDHAAGVIVHSEFSRHLARDWYGAQTAEWRTVPLLRGKGDARGRPDARVRLDIAPDDFLVCTFGMLGRTKLNEELLDAFLASRLAADPRCRLVFVGANDPGPYGAVLAEKIAASPARDRIAITGFVDASQYADYAAASDIAVQLRSNTRGETSAAVLDCLLHGAPTIVNAHGSSAELPDQLLLKLADGFSVGELTQALERLYADGALRAGYSQRALAWMEAEHAPARVGGLMAGAIEELHANSAQTLYRRLLDALAAISAEPSERDLTDAARAIALNLPPTAPRQLFVDVSAMVQSDLKTGIQRVVRSVLLALIADPPPGFRIEPVYSHGGNRGYLYARRFGLETVGETTLRMEDAPLELRRGDVFLGLDLFTNGTVQNEACLRAMRQRGVEIYFVVYDLLPVLRPEVFPFGTERYFKEFLTTVTAVADGVVCISRAVADELTAWVKQQPARRLAPLNIGYFHLGADIDASAPSTGMPPNAQQVFDAVKARPSFLMVGTVEPRKGQAQALAALELMWAQGVDANLVIVGKQGWMVEQLAEHMNGHPESGRRLFWLPGVSDEMLLALYARCSALLAASEGEGFGLPLIEAAQHEIPIIARDLPVFREVAAEHATYFTGLAPADLAAALTAWMQLQRDGAVPPSAPMPWLNWSQSAQQLLNAVVRQQWYKELPGS